MNLVERIALIILPVFLIVAIGYAYARMRGDGIRHDIAGVNRVSMDILAPLLVFTALASKEFDLAQSGWLIAAGVIIAAGSGLIAWPIARLLGFDARSFVPPMIYNNCGNMGFPLVVLAFGSSALPSAVALFLACNLVYFTLGMRIVSAGHAGTGFGQRILANPMVLAMIAGMVSAAFHIAWPPVLFTPMKMLGEAGIPIMLFSLGIRMRDVSLRSWPIGLAGAIVCPTAGLLLAWLLDHAMPLTAGQREQLYLFAALPPAVFCFMVAEQYRQEPEKVASIVLLGNAAALVFVPAGLWLGLHH